jgi:uncharacterized membrane protein YphA (DoxX/SURF4 family)
MIGLASLLAVALALVLLAAAVAKLRSPSRTTQDFAALGLPAPRLLARVVPAVELTVAVVLIAAPGWGGVAAFGLLVLFTALLVSLVRSGQTISCSCFGAVSDEPVSWVEVTRNGILLTMAAAVTPIDRLEVPGFAAIVGASAFAVIALVVLQLAVFKRDVGAVWSTHLSGEAPAT